MALIKLAISSFLLSLSAVASDVTTSNLNTVYDFIESDGVWFAVKDSAANNAVKSVTVVYQGRIDETTTQGQVDDINSQLKSKLHNMGLTVRDCIECGKQTVHLTKTSIKYKRGLETNDDLRQLGREIQSDAFLKWDMNIAQDSQNMILALVKSENNQVFWTDSFYRSELVDEIVEKQDRSQFGIALSNIALGAYPNSPRLNGFDNVTDFSLRYYTGRQPNEKLHFAVIANHFRSTDQNRNIDVKSYGAEGRILYSITDSWPKPSVYLGLGSQFIEGRNNLSVRTGVEFAVMKNLFFDLGTIYVERNDYHRMEVNSIPPVTFGGLAVDFTVGLRF
ncbi:hypothetical protein J4N39_17195 [Vibrio sp. SCSIO 43136]|nr:hypothetical protein J4N39_17195 [Vibrio sp. SCSIO 43136]